jgi:2-polyprenyl-3-methyl-5-hydroxy-6-metoxy-1,4-benzoquinol methylase
VEDFIWINPNIINTVYIDSRPRRVIPIAEHNIYKSVYDLIIRGIPLRDGKYHKRVKEQLDGGKRIRWNSKKIEVWASRTQKNIRDIAYSFKQKGYQENNDDPICAIIDSKGKIHQCGNGIHRLSIAKVIGLQRIQVQITDRSHDWIDTCETFRRTSRKRRSLGGIYQAPPHPDLIEVPHKYGLERAYRVLNASIYGKTMVDIGASLGLLCHVFEDEGFKCTAIESGNISDLKLLRDASNKKFSIWNGDAFNYGKIDADVVLGLNVFHHMMKSGGSRKMKEFLRMINANQILMSIPRWPKEKFNLGIKMNSDKLFAEFVANYSGMNNVEEVGYDNVLRKMKDSLGRPDLLYGRRLFSLIK